MVGWKGNDMVSEARSLRHEVSHRRYMQIETDIHQTLFVTDADITDRIWLCTIVNFYRW
jgi:hypothetical protein